MIIQSKQVYELLKTHDAFVDVYVPLWILGFPVPLSRIRQGLKRPLEVTSNDVAVEVDGRNAIEDTNSFRWLNTICKHT
jgi:hypothetical protein